MAVYNGLVGISEAALNRFVQAVHAAAHDAVLIGSVPVPDNALGVTGIDYDIATAPVVALRPSTLVRDAGAAFLAELGLNRPEAAAELASRASFDVDVPRLLLTLRYADDEPGTELAASLRAAVELVLRDDFLTPELGPMSIVVPGEPRLTEIINRALLPAVRATLTSFLQPIRIPPLGAGAVRVSPPAVVTGDGQLIATTALVPAIPEPAAPADGWPADQLYAGCDAALLGAALTELLARQRFAGTWSKRVDLLIGHLTVQVDYSVAVTDVSVLLESGHPGLLRGAATLEIFPIRIHAKPLGACTVRGTARATIQARVAVSAANALTVQPERVTDIQVDFDFHGLPEWADRLVSNSIDVLGSAMASLLSSEIARTAPREVAKLPSLPIALPGATLLVGAMDVQVTTLQTPDGKRLLAATGVPDVRVNQLLGKHSVTGD